VILPDVVRINAYGGSTIVAAQRGGNGGLVVGYGSNVAAATTEMEVRASLGAGNRAPVGQQVSILLVTADHEDDSDVFALAGAGSLGAAFADTSVTLTDTAKSLASVGAANASVPLNVGTLVVSANREHKYSTQAEAYFGSAVAAVGLPNVKYDGSSTAMSRIDDRAEVVASGPVVLRSEHRVTRVGEGLAARLAGGGLVTASGDSVSGSTNTLASSSTVKVGDSAVIRPASDSAAMDLLLLPASHHGERDDGRRDRQGSEA
jgi:hypothetical protein